MKRRRISMGWAGPGSLGTKDDKYPRTMMLSSPTTICSMREEEEPASGQHTSVQCWSLANAHWCVIMESPWHTSPWLHQNHAVDSEWTQPGSPERNLSSATLQSQLHDLSQLSLSHCIHLVINKTSRRALHVLFQEPCWGPQINNRWHSLCPLREFQASVMSALRMVVCTD